MENLNEIEADIKKAGEDLFHFAVDREDLKLLMSRLPEEAGTKRETVEYELQILKIIATGWSVTYFLENFPYKDQLAEVYWEAIFQYSLSISESASLMIGQQIDYFQILQERLGMYVKAMQERSEALEPAAVVGPEFGRTCGNVDSIFIIMTGSRMFKETVASVKEYFEKVRIV